VCFLYEDSIGVLFKELSITQTFFKLHLGVSLPPRRTADRFGADGQLYGPNDVTVLPSDEVAVADGGNHRICIFDGETAQYLRKFGTARFHTLQVTHARVHMSRVHMSRVHMSAAVLRLVFVKCR
jgi:hypothetical protein